MIVSAFKKLFHRLASSHKSSYLTVFSQSEIGYLVYKFCWNNFLTALMIAQPCGIHPKASVERE